MIEYQHRAKSDISMNESSAGWNFFSNYAHVLVCLADNSHARLRDVAERVGITERTALRLITELEEVDILKRAKEGRRNSYFINLHAHLRHPLESHCTVGDLLATLMEEPAAPSRRGAARASSKGR